jgi:arginase family enzyme
MKIISIGKNAAAEKAQGIINESGMLPVLDIEEINEDDVYEKASEAFKQLQNVMFIGKDHLKSKEIIKAFSESFENPGIVVFDAHPDSENDEDMLPYLIKNSIISPKNIILIGTRTWKKQELEFLNNYKIKQYTMKEISQEGIHEVCDSAMSVAKDFGSLYISIDIDVVDPGSAPGTGAVVPGGLSSRELIYFLQRLKILKNLKACDLFEVNPDKDINEITLTLAAKIIAEMC